jgi:hypothetical protein
MKSAFYLILVLILPSLAARAAGPEFPGLKAIMSEEAWQQAKLDRLDPNDLRLINAAFAQYLQGAVAQAKIVPGNATPATPEQRQSLWSRFGLGAAAVATQAAKEPLMMQAKVTAWQGRNGFVLDNGQVWSGIDPIRDELVGREIGIKEGRLGSFLLVLDGETTNVRLNRVK